MDTGKHRYFEVVFDEFDGNGFKSIFLKVEAHLIPHELCVDSVVEQLAYTTGSLDEEDKVNHRIEVVQELSNYAFHKATSFRYVDTNSLDYKLLEELTGKLNLSLSTKTPLAYSHSLFIQLQSLFQNLD